MAVLLLLSSPHLSSEPRSLTLHIPCEWDGDVPAFHDSGPKNLRTNPGKCANLYHRKFSRATRRDSLADIAMALHLGCRLEVHRGFHERNSFIAQADYLLAFTWGATAPVDGGTLDTWQKCKTTKVHVSLHDLQSHAPHDTHDGPDAKRSGE